MPEQPSRFFRLPWRSRNAIARDVDTELEFHLEMRVHELIALGMTPDAARQRATQDFGDVEFTRKYCSDIDERTDRGVRLADRFAELRQDARYALRTIRRNPSFAAICILTTAIAIGANTAIFSVARAVLLKPLSYGAPGELVAMYEGPLGNADRWPLSPPNFVDYRAQQRTFSDVAAYLGMGWVTWRPENAEPSSVSAAAIGANLLSVLSVKPALGRSFSTDSTATAAEDAVIISDAFWRRELAGDSAAVGRRLTLNGRSYEVIGVMPRGFTVGLDEEVWLPLDMRDDLAQAARTRKQHYVHAIGRLKRGTSFDAASADVQAIGARLGTQYPEANSQRTGKLVPLHEALSGSFRTPLWLLQGAAAMVLLIACANLGNLTLSRTIGRRREMALRAALGAGRGRLIRQLLAESVSLAVIGGVLGILLAVVATRTLLALNPNALPERFSATMDASVLGFSALLALATGIMFGLVPALDGARANLHDSLKESGRGAVGGRGGERLRRTLVVAQVALAVTLLVGAGLLVRSFGALTRAQIGFDPDHVLTAQVRATGPTLDSAAAINRFYDGVLASIAQTPGVTASGAVTIIPTRGRVSSSLRIEGEANDERNLPDIGYISMRGDYLGAMHIPIVAGRNYNATDIDNGAKTVIINEAAAHRFFPRGDAVGRRIRIGPNPQGEWMTIVGVIGDVRDEGFGVAARPTLFANHRQETWDRTLTIVVRTTGGPQAMAPVIRRAVMSMNPGLAVRDVRTMNDIAGASLAPRRFALGLAAAFAGVALLLASVGIYGVLAYMVSSRSREFGVRLALGQSTRGVLMLVAREGVTWTSVGLVLGIGGAIAAGRLLTGLLYNVSPIDGATYVSVAAGLLVVGAIACLVPAVRATRVDPLTSMRGE